MWRPWSKSPARIHNSSATTPTTNFSCSTFKDIQNLCTPEDSDSNSNSNFKSNSNCEAHITGSKKLPVKVFHRVCAATTLVRSWSSSRQQLLQSNLWIEPKRSNANSTETTSSSNANKNSIARTVSEPQPFINAAKLLLDSSSSHHQISSNTSKLDPSESNAGSTKTSSNILLRTISEPQPLPNPTQTLDPENNAESPQSISLPGSEKQIVVYFTSLRVVRRTFEDCKAVRSIIRGFKVSIDERDLSMDSRFLKELQQQLRLRKSEVTLPRVFIGGRYIGGVEEIRQLHENGDLKKFVGGLPAVDSGVVCDVCGGYSFVLCDDCNGSHKIYTEKSKVFRSCLACNENGLIRCPPCSAAHL